MLLLGTYLCMDLYSLTGGVSIEVLASTGNAGWVQVSKNAHNRSRWSRPTQVPLILQ